LRPRIYAKVLGRRYPEWAGLVSDNWEAILSHQDPLTVKNADGSSVSIDDVISPGPDLDLSKPLDSMIDVILGSIEKLTVPKTWIQYLDSANKTIYGIYASFEAAMNALAPDMTPAQISEEPGASPGSIAFEQLMKRAMDPSNAAEGEVAWLPLFRANGWTTKGPRGRDE
jgi:hypothetical protein